MAEGDNEDKSQKTEDPTEKRIQDAREKGQIAKSKEIDNFAVLLTLLILSTSLFSSMASYYSSNFSQMLENFYDYEVNEVIFTWFFQKFLILLSGPLFIFLIAEFVSAFVQNQGFLFTTESYMPKLERISILKGLNRLFSFNTVFEFIKGLLKISLVGIILFFLIRNDFENLGIFFELDVLTSISKIERSIYKLLLATVIILSFITIADFSYQKYKYHSELKMTKQEIKEEYKQSEGNPEIKAKLKKIRNERARKRMSTSVPKADFILTNPTHYSVALIYKEDSMNAPKVIAKGIDFLAKKIKEIAKKHDIPIIEKPELARAIYQNVEIDQEIPLIYYKAVAEIVSYVYKIKKKK